MTFIVKRGNTYVLCLSYCLSLNLLAQDFQNTTTTHSVERPRERVFVKFELPVAWQITQAKFVSPGPLMQTETFRETWILEFKNDGHLILTTPHAKAPVIRPIPEIYDGTKPPDSVILTHRDLAKLLGILKFLEKPSISNDKNNTPANTSLSPANPKLDQFLSLNFSSLISSNVTENSIPGNDVVLSLNEDEHFNIRIELDSPKF